uniref:Uncharacterized protein n=1 Tax=Anopheles maculatus TaxID=74869 RepID=A0A182SKS0_9DIPT
MGSNSLAASTVISASKPPHSKPHPEESKTSPGTNTQQLTIVSPAKMGIKKTMPHQGASLKHEHHESTVTAASSTTSKPTLLKASSVPAPGFVGAPVACSSPLGGKSSA